MTTICMSFDLKVLNFHSFDCQCFGSYVVSQLTSGDGLSVGMAHVHMAEHDDFSICPLVWDPQEAAQCLLHILWSFVLEVLFLIWSADLDVTMFPVTWSHSNEANQYKIQTLKLYYWFWLGCIIKSLAIDFMCFLVYPSMVVFLFWHLVQEKNRCIREQY